ASEAAKPAPAAPSETGLKIVQREAPGFPREALLANVSSGSVKVRMTVDGGGNVTKVDILEASPRRVFDREVQRTLARWKFEATGQTQTAETEVVFRRD
ncbi:MAG: TonB family protein, partial [Burkholderiales bacterium]